MPVQWRGPEMVARLHQATMRGIVRATEHVRARGIDLILNNPKTGKVYRRRGVEHQASAPGESPASDTGRLVQSASTSYDAENLTGRVTFATAYAEALELGTLNMEPRPFLRPALDQSRADIVQFIREEIAKGAKS